MTIADSGPGISEKDLPRIFEPFYSTKSSGTGLGLAIAKSIIDNHNGAITISNRPAGGTLAEVHLPRAEEDN
jgi:signal transduction histidine kinase